VLFVNIGKDEHRRIMWIGIGLEGLHYLFNVNHLDNHRWS